MAVKIFIDQGHNPSTYNTGAVGNGLNEADITYTVGRYLADLLNQNGNFETMLSRNSPDEIIGTSNASSLSERVRMANDWGADYFISIHTNAVANPQANGTEVLTFRNSGRAYNLAEDVLASIVTRLNMRDRGVKPTPSLYVLRRTTMPAILIELGFITNYSDSQKMANNPYGFAYAIYLGILDYLNL